METTTTRYPVLDESGKVRTWMDAGRKVRVWKSADLSMYRPDMLTPGDVSQAPHWAYPVADSRMLDVGNVIFYEACSIDSKLTWTDTPAGWKAAEKALAQCPDTSESRLVGHCYRTHTLKAVQLESKEKRSDGKPLCISFRVGVLQWSSVDKVCKCSQCVGGGRNENQRIAQ